MTEPLPGIFPYQQQNPNPLYNNKFTFSIIKIPEVSWSCRAANIPSTSMPVAVQNTQFNPIPRSGTHIDYEPLVIEFIVDEDWNNYIELVNWMRLMAMPVNNQGYGQLKFQNTGSEKVLQPGPDGGLVSDAQLVVLSNESVPNLVTYYRDAFPIYLGEIIFRNDVEAPEVKTCEARFAYTYFDIEAVNPNGSWSVPVISSISPASGPNSGGTIVTIIGSGFTGLTGQVDITAVAFGIYAGVLLPGGTDTQIRVMSPVFGVNQVVQLSVTSPGGVSNTKTFTVA